ncbi:helix-turn-helix transcriptional regulator [Agarivorans sp. MS3-6]
MNYFAKLLMMHPRSVQRELKQQGSSFQAIKEKVFLQIAVQLLSDKSLSVNDVAFELSYLNSTHFVRAFKRLTGLTPGEYRRNVE